MVEAECHYQSKTSVRKNSSERLIMTSYKCDLHRSPNTQQHGIVNFS
jgi:hypothetical protein